MKDSTFEKFVTQDLLSQIEGISSRAMFGGYGIYQNGTIFAIISDDRLYFKVDDSSRAKYEKHNSKPFTYSQKKNKTATMSYWELPIEIMEDRNALAKWAEESVQVSRNKK